MCKFSKSYNVDQIQISNTTSRDKRFCSKIKLLSLGFIVENTGWGLFYVFKFFPFDPQYC